MTNNPIPNSINFEDWNDWRWQLRNQIHSIEQLEEYITLTDKEKEEISLAGQRYRWAITPYYANLMQRDNPYCPLRIQQVPSIQEIHDNIGIPDPLSEKQNSPVDAVVHVYPDRVAFKVTNICPTYCRYCFREYFVGNLQEHHTRDKIRRGIEYISEHPSIRDVLLTGGDPLLLSDDRLENIIRELRLIPHVEIIRIGSRTPCTLPQRITPQLCNILEKYHPIWLNTHFNHPNEITTDAAAACNNLLKAGVPVGNQAVLLKGVNDDIDTMKELIHRLLKIRVRPYYIYQCQILHGTEHLRTTIEKGLEIMQGLRGFTTGFGVPVYVLDTPYGKVPLSLSNILGRSNDDVVVRCFSGKIWHEPNPVDPQDKLQVHLPLV